MYMFIHGRPVCTYCMCYCGICVCILGCSEGRWEVCVCACTVHRWMLLIPVFFGVQSGISAVSSPHPQTHIHAHTHIRVWQQHPSAWPWLPPSLSSWHSLWVGWEHTLITHWYFSRGVLWGFKPVAADGHSWEGLVSLGDSRAGGECVSLYVFVHTCLWKSLS